MKKQTKSSLTRKLDKETSRIIRSYGSCVWCKKEEYDKLQCAHIFSRTFRNTRWDLKNLLPLCQSCHFYGHRNPISFTEMVMCHLGEYEYNALKIKHNSIKRWTIPEMEELLKTLKGIQCE
jgi:hypothetical protein